MAEQYDLVVLGGGPGGYVGAIRAAQLGMKVALVEKENVGGVCLHKGCIPTKSMLYSASLYHQMKESETYGIRSENVQVDLSMVHSRKNQIIGQLQKGVEHLLKKNKVDVYSGYGRILGPSIFSPLPGTVSVQTSPEEEGTLLVPQNLLLATGSSPRFLEGLDYDGQSILNSDHALQMEELPNSMLILGGGAIGIEWASMLSDFGVDVTVLEVADRILPGEDVEISREMTRVLKKKGVKVFSEVTVAVDTVQVIEGEVKLQAEVKGASSHFSAEKLLVSVGRTPNVKDIGLDNTAIKVERGAVVVNPFQQTAEKHIYAIGDLVGGFQLAHVAMREAVIAVEHMADQSPEPLQKRQVPRCIYSRPEVASIGFTEQEAKDQGYQVKVGKVPFRTVGKSLVMGEVDGMVKLVVDAKTEDLLGAHLIGADATNLISEAGLAQLLDGTAWEIGQLIHPHPTLSELIGEAALAVDGLAIHG
ncbi:dihydrolipoyl dehydrogenase [Risungbinella massiliensis]|uniref:dihydrolipoyl dehydrogenase n=1 Tax=Risungbinella massiliensis TaxID=1329796 RepID=UPI0005CB92CA|nr:dihydrolipoyl dehydrogenase [Risungbinella massiliensis]